MLNKLDNILFDMVNLGILGFLLYSGEMYSPESSATLLLEFIAFIVILWFIADVFIALNDRRIIKK